MQNSCPTHTLDVLAALMTDCGSTYNTWNTHLPETQVLLEKTFPKFWGFAGTEGPKREVQMNPLHYFDKSDGTNGLFV